MGGLIAGELFRLFHLWQITALGLAHARIDSVTCLCQSACSQSAKPTRGAGDDDDLLHVEILFLVRIFRCDKIKTWKRVRRSRHWHAAPARLSSRRRGPPEMTLDLPCLLAGRAVPVDSSS